MITISAFAWAPEFAHGKVRDLRVRWALEEAGLPYTARLLEQGDQDTPEYRALQPFEQVPIYQEGDLTLFESGAIAMHIGERTPALMPTEANARARARQWVLAALNSVEPAISNVLTIDLFHPDSEWGRLRRPEAVAFAERRLSGLVQSLGEKAYLDGDIFTVGDLIMATVLRIMPALTDEHAVLTGYVARCTARPAFKRALDAQIGDFRKTA
jgi:glutathione S-transferase